MCPRRDVARRRPTERRAIARSLFFGLLFGPLLAAADVPTVATVEYAIERGDTCSAIAEKFYGDGGRWDIIHEFNPRLGPTLPHRLVPGETLTLPPDIPPDAWVTEVVQRVEHRPDTVERWRPAASGTPLSMGYRVNTHVRSAAELTFRDASRVELHQNTLLVIYGRTARETAQSVNRVRLARGTLRSRLAGLRGDEPTSGLRLESASAVATMGAGDAMMSADGVASAVSNHGGGPIAVSGVGAGGEVAVTAGMGTTVEKGRAPAAPRPLPDAPSWDTENPTMAWGAAPTDAALDLRWQPVDVAARYRIELQRGDVRFAAADLPRSPASTTLAGLPAGRYTARLRVTDGDGLVSVPSAPWAFEIVAVADGADVPVGARIAGCHRPDAPAPDVRVAAGENALLCAGDRLTVRGREAP